MKSQKLDLLIRNISLTELRIYLMEMSTVSFKYIQENIWIIFSMLQTEINSKYLIFKTKEI